MPSVNPIFRAKYHVLVVDNAKNADESHQRTLAICLEKNLVGRGATQGEALTDLAETLFESVMYWLSNESIPAPAADPDPRLLEAFKDRSARTTDEGDGILNRLSVTIAIDAIASKRRRPSPRDVVYEEPELALA